MLIFYIALSALLPSQHKKSSLVFFLSYEKPRSELKSPIPTGLFQLKRKRLLYYFVVLTLIMGCLKLPYQAERTPLKVVYRAIEGGKNSVQGFLSVDPLADHPNQVDKSPYAYAWNNPVYYTDPDGRCPTCPTAAIGAVVGGVVGGASSAIGSWWRGEDISWSAVGKAAVAGAVSGAIVGSGAGVVAAMGGLVEAGAGGIMVTVGTGVASGIAGETTSQGLDMLDGTRDSGDFDIPAIAESGAVGGALNIVAAGAGQALKGPISNATSQVFGASKETIKAAQKAAGNQVKVAGGTKAAFQNARSTAKSTTIQAGQQRAAVATQVTATTVSSSTRKTGDTIIKNRKDYE